MKYAESVYKTFTELRKNGKELAQERNEKLKKIESFKGSRGYEEKKKAIEKDYENRLKDYKKKARDSIKMALNLMNWEIDKRGVEDVPEKYKSIIDTFTKFNPKQEEIQRCYNIINDNDLAVAMLNKVATDNNLKPIAHQNKISNKELKEGLEEIARQFKTTYKLPEFGNRQRYINYRAYGGDGVRADLFRVDKDYSDNIIGFYKRDIGLPRGADFVNFFDADI